MYEIKEVETMTTKLEKIWVCDECGTTIILGLDSPPKQHQRAMYHVIGLNHDPICTGQIRLVFSQSSLVELLKGRIEEYKVNVKFYGQPEISIVDKDNPTVKELQSLLSMIEKGE